MGPTYSGCSVALVTAADEKFAGRLSDLCDSLGAWRRYLHVIDIGLADDSRDALKRAGIESIRLPAGFFANARFATDYFRALYLRPSLPDLFPHDIIMWIDADCWIQREEALATYFDSAIAFPDKFTLCAMLDIEYGRCIDDYWRYQEGYREQYAALFGADAAKQMFGKAVLSAGVFAARRTAPAWAEWRAVVSQVYESDIALARFDLGHMGDQLSLNMVLHRSHGYRLLNAEMNWHCHCSDVARDGQTVRIRPSGRTPAIVHLSDLKNPEAAQRYRANRLFYEKRDGAARDAVAPPPRAPAILNAAAATAESRHAPLQICVYTCLVGNSEALNEQPTAAQSRLPFICFTDNPGLRSETWQVRVVPRLFAMDPVRSQRQIKILPHKYLPEFDASLYIDNSVLLRQPPEALVEKYFPASGFCILEHSYRATVDDEFIEVARLGLDDQNRIFEQREHYKIKYPEILSEKPYWGAILLRDHRNPAVAKMLELWFAHVQRYSRRDQLSVNLAFRLAGLSPDVLRYDNFESEYHSWPHKKNGGQMESVEQIPREEFTFDERLQALEIDLLSEKKKVEALNASLMRLDRNAADTRHQNEALLASTSWRLTAPMRALSRLLRRLG